MSEYFTSADNFLWLTGAVFWLWLSYRIVRIGYAVSSLLADALWPKKKRKPLPPGAYYARGRALPWRGSEDFPYPQLEYVSRGRRKTRAKRPLRRAAAGAASLGRKRPDESTPSDEPALRSQGAQVLPLRTRGRPRKAAVTPAPRLYARRGRKA